MKKVIVRVVGTQTDAEGEENRIELVSVGSREDRPGVSYVTYRESEISGLEGTTTLLKIYDDHFTIVRMGTVEHKQEFFPGRKSFGTYITPYGSMKMAVSTRSLEMSGTAEARQLAAAYDLEINGRWQSYNTLAVEIREEEKHGH